MMSKSRVGSWDTTYSCLAMCADFPPLSLTGATVGVSIRHQNKMEFYGG